jgi:hypothetical protein
VAAAVSPVPRAAPHGLHLRLAPPGRAPTVVTVPLAPGLVTEVGVVQARQVSLGEAVPLTPLAGCLALDGEREVELGPSDRVTVRLAEGPLVIDVDAALALAARQRVLNGSAWPRAPTR